jgi:hypothetical protein
MDTIELWGSENCTSCEGVATMLKLKGYAIVRKDFDTLIDESHIKRADIRSAYDFQGAFPIIYFNNQAYTVTEFKNYSNEKEAV